MARQRNRATASGLAAAVVVASVALLAACTTNDDVRDAPQTTTSTSPVLASSGSTEPRSNQPHRHHSGPLLVVGDSLTLGADTNGLTKLLRADGWQPSLIAEVGRSTRGAITAVQNGPRTVSRLVLVELGTNPSSAISTFPEEVDAMVDLLRSRGAEIIVWVTPVHHDDDRYGDKVRALQAKAVADPRFFVADWESIAWAHKSWFNTDGLHYNSTGFAALAQLMADEADLRDPA